MAIYLLSELSPNEAEIHIDELKKQENDHSEILPFLCGATKASRQGVRSSHLISYHIKRVALYYKRFSLMKVSVPKL